MKGLSNKKNGFPLALLLSAVLFFVSCTVGIPSAKVSAAGEGAYFTIENETLYTGADSSQLNFTLAVHNESGSQSIDLNGYGVRVTSGSASYPASLTTQYSARVKIGQSSSFNYAAMVPGNVDKTALQATVFQWDSSSPSYMRDIATFPFKESALQSGNGQTVQTLINLKPLDAALPQGASATFQLGNTYSVNRSGQWTLATELWVTNIGDSSFKLPTALTYQMLDASKNTFAASVVDGGAKTLLPKKPMKLTLETPVANPYTEDEGLTLQVLKTSTADPLVLGSLGLKGSLRLGEARSAQTYNGIWQNKALTLTAGAVTGTEQDDGQHIRVKVTAANTGPSAVALPTLAGSFQFGADGYAAASAGTGTHPSYLPSGTSANYYFTAVLPKGVSLDDVQLVTYESKAGASVAGGGSGASAASALLLPVAVTQLKGVNLTDETVTEAKPYTLGTTMALENNQAIDSNLKIALGELSLADTDAFGYRTAVAKFKVSNTGTKKMAVPILSTQLVGAGGMEYEGVNSQTAAQQISPKTSIVATYTYLLPPDETGEALTLKLNDDKSAAPDKIPVASYKTAVQSQSESDIFNIYPFKLEMTGKYFYQSVLDRNSTSYNYTFKVDWKVSQTEPAIVNAAFSKLEFDLVNANGKILGSNLVPFTGVGKVDNSGQQMSFSVKMEENTLGLQIRIYETVTTPDGTVKRLIRTIPI